MLSLEDLQVISRRAEERREWLTSEESIKISLVQPFIGALGYDFQDPSEVAAELAADVGTRNHEKVDYAILRDGKPIILVECKPLANSLGAGEMSQLTRYFNNTDDAIGILTNGVVYKFFTDLIKTNIMDQTPFWEVDIRSADEGDVVRLRQFANGNFDAEKIKKAAIETNIITGAKANLQKMYAAPDDEFSGVILRNVSAGNLAAEFAASHRELVKRAFLEFVREHTSAGVSGELPQDTTSVAPQSAPEQAAAIPPTPSPVAPTDGCRSLSGFQPNKSDAKPKQIQVMFPDNSSVAITAWKQLIVEVVRWLTDNNHLTKVHCPIKIPESKVRYLVAEQPTRPSGEPHPRMAEVNSLWVVADMRYDHVVGNTRFVIQQAGMNPSQFKLRW